MDQNKFRRHLAKATKQLIDFTQSLCFNDFSDAFRYTITPSSRTLKKDVEHLNEFEISVLITWNKFENQPLTADQAVELLHHKNKVPLWIDMSVYEANSDLTIIDLFCSRRLRPEEELKHQGLHPFHPIVAIPPESLIRQTDGKFDVNWRKKMRR